MIKHILVLTFCIIALSATQVAPTANIADFGDFLQGFNDQLNIEADTVFASCEKIPIIPDLTKTFHDLNANNYFSLITDVMALYKDYHNIKSNCPQIAKDYEQYFASFVSAIEASPKKVGIQVLQNVLSNFGNVGAALSQAHQDIISKNYYDLGGSIGKVVGYALHGYVN